MQRPLWKELKCSDKWEMTVPLSAPWFFLKWNKICKWHIDRFSLQHCRSGYMEGDYSANKRASRQVGRNGNLDWRRLFSTMQVWFGLVYPMQSWIFWSKSTCSSLPPHPHTHISLPLWVFLASSYSIGPVKFQVGLANLISAAITTRWQQRKTFSVSLLTSSGPLDFGNSTRIWLP